MTISTVLAALAAVILSSLASAGATSATSASPPQRTPPIPQRYLDPVFDEVTVTSDIVYVTIDDEGTPLPLELDVYQPVGDTAIERPLFVWIHGGSFAFGDKADPLDAEISTDMAKRGFVTASINYRLLEPQAPGDDLDYWGIAQVAMDARAAVGWLYHHAAEYGIDRDHVVVSGASAGAITALNVAYFPVRSIGEGAEGHPQHVDAAVAIAGTSFGLFAEVGEAPALMFHGTQDTTVPFGWAEDFCTEVDAKGIECELRTFPTDHLGIAAYKAQMQEEMAAWLSPRIGLADAAQDLPAPFSDVLWGHPFFHAIAWADDSGVSTGYPDGTFRPGAVTTRQAVVAWLWRLAGSPAPAAAPTFTDVPPDHPFADAIAWATETSLTTGYPDGTFRPGATTTRQAVMAWMWRQAGSPPPAGAPTFTDVPPDHPFADAIAWAAETSLTTGYDDGTFHPGAVTTRQAVMAWLWRRS